MALRLLKSTDSISSASTDCFLDTVSSLGTTAAEARGGSSGSGMQGQPMAPSQRRRLQRIALEPPAFGASDIIAWEPDQRR